MSIVYALLVISFIIYFCNCFNGYVWCLSVCLTYLLSWSIGAALMAWVVVVLCYARSIYIFVLWYGLLICDGCVVIIYIYLSIFTRKWA